MKSMKNLCFVSSALLSYALLSPSLLAAERIVSAGAGISELIIALNGSKQLVATDSTSRLPQGLTLPNVGYHRQLASEGILALQPTVLVGSDEMGPDHTLQQLQQAGVRIDKLSSRADVATLQQNIQHLGTLLDQATAAKQLSQQVDQQVTALHQQAGQLKQRPRLLYLMIHPGRPAMVAGGNTPASTLIELAGGMNPAAELANYQLLNLESLLAMKPDALLVSTRSLKQDPQLLQHAFAQISDHPQLQNLPVYPIPGQALIGGMNLSTVNAATRLQQVLVKAETTAENH